MSNGQNKVVWHDAWKECAAVSRRRYQQPGIHKQDHRRTTTDRDGGHAYPAEAVEGQPAFKR